MMLPAQTASVTVELAPIIQVWNESSVVPVLPMSGMPFLGFDAEPVPPFITPWSAYATPAAISGVMACRQSFFCPPRSVPSGATILSMAMASQ